MAPLPNVYSIHLRSRELQVRVLMGPFLLMRALRIARSVRTAEHGACSNGIVGRQPKLCKTNFCVHAQSIYRTICVWMGSAVTRGYGATAARLTPDQKVGSSNLSALILADVFLCVALRS